MSIHIIDEEKWIDMKFPAGCKIYEESPDGEGTAYSLLVFMKIFRLERSGWNFFMMYWFEVNTAAVNLSVTLFDNFNVNVVRCLYHLLSLVGKKMYC